MAQLDVSEGITAESHQTVSHAFNGIAELLERSRAAGPMQDAPLGFVLTPEPARSPRRRSAR